MRRLGTAAYGFLAYGCFLATFLHLIAFLTNLGGVKSIDGGAGGSVIVAVVVDFLLLALFGLQHSIMARPAFKRWWTKYVRQELERSTYVLLASVMLAVMMWGWQPLPLVLWDFAGTWLGTALVVTCALGWLLVLASTFTIDHFQLFGLKQVLFFLLRRRLPAPRFVVRGLYHIVRHPLMLGFLIAFWATPVMTAGHLLFASIMTGYILIALRYEERDLLDELGQQYAAYCQKVPMLNPLASPALHPDPAPDPQDAVPLYMPPRSSVSGGFRIG